MIPSVLIVLIIFQKYYLLNKVFIELKLILFILTIILFLLYIYIYIYLITFLKSFDWLLIFFYGFLFVNFLR